MLRALFDRVRKLFSQAATTPPPEPVGCTIVRVRVFGRDREVRLVGTRGLHAIAEAADTGPAGMYLIDESKVLPPDVEKFRAWRRTLGKSPT